MNTTATHPEFSDTVIEIRAGSIQNIDCYLARGLQLKVGDACIVRTHRGLEIGKVVRTDVMSGTSAGPTNEVLRKASLRDLRTECANRLKERVVLAKVLQAVQKHHLAMKLVKVEMLFDQSAVIVYYTAEGRVDFRDLLKALTSMLRCRVEMRQIGPRDAARLLGGVGPCGRAICCTSFLRDFGPVSLRTAKKLGGCCDPCRLIGLCGKPRCCHAFEETELARAELVRIELSCA